jgi:hypothetical protein
MIVSSGVPSAKSTVLNAPSRQAEVRYATLFA